MNNSSAMLPFILGLVIGAVSLSGLAFANGWVVTGQKMDMAVADADIGAQASICVARARTYLRENNITADLSGNQATAREMRDQLARDHAVVLPGYNSVQSRVLNACARQLSRTAN